MLIVVVVMVVVLVVQVVAEVDQVVLVVVVVIEAVAVVVVRQANRRAVVAEMGSAGQGRPTESNDVLQLLNHLHLKALRSDCAWAQPTESNAVLLAETKCH